jgi:hypothetical protein
MNAKCGVLKWGVPPMGLLRRFGSNNPCLGTERMVWGPHPNPSP